MADTFFVDVSEWQRAPVDDSYPWPWLSIRSNDGTYRDKKWRANWDNARRMLDRGKLRGLIVYAVVRPNWQQSLEVHLEMMGEARPDVCSMADAESWEGQIVGDHSHAFNSFAWGCSDFYGWGGTGTLRQVCGYLNPNDHSVWPNRPDTLPFVVPSYGAYPKFTTATADLRDKMFAHQYTNGVVANGNLPLGASPFGNCDVNVANGLDAEQLRTLLLGSGSPIVADSVLAEKIPTQFYREQDGSLRPWRAGDDESRRYWIPLWDLLSWADGRSVRTEAVTLETLGHIKNLVTHQGDLEAKVDKLLRIVEGLQ